MNKAFADALHLVLELASDRAIAAEDDPRSDVVVRRIRAIQTVAAALVEQSPELMTFSLGERLHATKRALKDSPSGVSANLIRHQQLDEAKREHRAHEDLARFFEDLRDDLARALDEGKVPGANPLPRTLERRNALGRTMLPDDPNYPYAEIVTRIKADLAEEGLMVVFSMTHDGAGIAAWVEGQLAPLPGPLAEE